jgi:hypothetical protein
MDQDQLSPEAVAALLADELPITGSHICFTAGAQTTALPVVAVDATARPDLLDLGRVIRMGSRQVSIGATTLAPFLRPPEAFIVLTIGLVAPVNCSLKLIFRLPQQSQLIESIVKAPRFVLTPSPIDPNGVFDSSQAIVLACPDPTETVRQTVDLVDSWPDGG